MKLFTPLLCILFTQTIHSCILQVSIPKSGTHAVKKCMNLILKTKEDSLFKIGFAQPERFQQTPEQFRKMLKTLSRISTHLIYNAEFETILKEYFSTVVYSIRHPLDVLVSWAYYIIKKRNYFPHAAGLSFEEIIDSILDDGYVSYHVTPRAKVYALPGNGLKEAYENYLSWMDVSNVLTVKFEDLVGPHGGGNLELQKQTIKKIAKHLGASISQERVDHICKHLFGGTTTFRKGKIGIYKEELSPRQLEKALEIMQPIIDKLGYDF